MTYVPNPTDATQPTGNVDASTADDEFRALKAYVLGLALTAGMFAPVRQCANDGFVDGNGDPALFTAAAAGGLALDFKATGRPLVVNFAGGSTGTGVNDRNSTLTADVANVITNLPASNLSFIYADYVNAASMTFGSTLIPPQYGKFFDKSKSSLLRFVGADAAVTFLDDYGNTWAPVGNAQIDTAVQIDGLNTLLLDGAGDYIESTNFLSFGFDSWTIEAKVRWNTLPAASTQNFFAATNAAGQGIRLGLNDTAGVKKLSLTLSSDGATGDIAATVLGTSTVWAAATTYHIALVYDALAAKYIVYKDGVAEAALTIASAARICAFGKMRFGDNGSGASQLNGCMAGIRVSPCCRYPNAVAFAVPNISTFAVEGDAFDIQGMKMYMTTAASVVAGNPPTQTQKYRVYLADVDTSAIAPATIRSYVFNGKYVSADTVLAAVGTRTAFSANLGLIPLAEPTLLVKNILGESGLVPGMLVRAAARIDVGDTLNMQVCIENRNSLSVVQGGTTSLIIANRVNGVFSTPTTTNWRMQLIASRGWGGA